MKTKSLAGTSRPVSSLLANMRGLNRLHSRLVHSRLSQREPVLPPAATSNQPVAVESSTQCKAVGTTDSDEVEQVLVSPARSYTPQLPSKLVAQFSSTMDSGWRFCQVYRPLSRRRVSNLAPTPQLIKLPMKRTTRRRSGRR